MRCERDEVRETRGERDEMRVQLKGLYGAGDAIRCEITVYVSAGAVFRLTGYYIL